MGVYAYENPAPSMLAVCKAVDNCVCEGRIDENPGSAHPNASYQSLSENVVSWALVSERTS
jgi:hypothetical protein